MHNLLCCGHRHLKKTPHSESKCPIVWGFFKDSPVTLDQGFRGELVYPSKLVF